jgi:hypothetical protein
MAAGLLSSQLPSQAQSSNVYSVNVVGYYNIPIGPNGYWFLANQLTNAGNSVNIVLTNGPRSDVNGIVNTVLYAWNGNGYDLYQFFTGADADAYFILTGSANGWYDAVGNIAPATLAQGVGNFLYNPSGSSITNTLVGEVVQRTNSVPILTGFNALSLIPPVSTNFDGAFGNFPGVSDVNAVNNDVYYKFNGNGYDIFQYFTGADADAYFLTSGSINGWYDAIGTYVSTTPAFIPKVGEAFFIRRFGSPSNWVYSFSVQ